MKSVSSEIIRILLLSAVLVAVPAGSAHAQGTSDESLLRDYAGRSSTYTGEVGELLERGVDPNVPDSRGRTAVHAAAAIGAAETLDLLLEAGGEPDARDDDGNTPLHFAADTSSPILAEDESIGAIRILLEHQAEPNRANQNGETPLHLAARSHDWSDGVTALLNAGASPDKADRRGNTPLHAALGPNRGVSGVVGALLHGGANPEAVNADGLTPLLWFVRQGPDRGDAVALLLDAGAHPNRKGPGGEAPLHIAVRTGGNRGKVEVAEALLAGGADPCVRDDRGVIPYSVAAEGGPIHQALERADGHDRACDSRGEVADPDSDQRRRVQAALAAAGFDPGPADGQFGPRTRRAIGAWQEAAGYAATGELTGEQVEVLLAGPAQAPGPTCEGVAEGAECWQEIADRPGCHVWNYHNLPGKLYTWSGSCSGGLAVGEGELVWTWDNWSVEQTGSLSDGKQHGRWTEIMTSPLTDTSEGPYVDGKKHGHWTVRSDDGYAAEGPYVENRRHGHWTIRYGDGRSQEGSFADGDATGQHWIFRNADGSVREKGRCADQVCLSLE